MDRIKIVFALILSTILLTAITEADTDKSNKNEFDTIGGYHIHVDETSEKWR